MGRLTPETAQDRGDAHHYEGYYARLSLPEEGESLAIVGAMARSEAGTEVYAFTLDGRAAERTLVRFAADDFELDPGSSSARFGTVTLSPERLVGSVGDTSFDLRLEGRLRWPNLVASPLGPSLVVPGLDSHWHVASLDGGWHGQLVHAGIARTLEGAPGYVEKTWGSRFPERWTWLHAHAFDRPDVALAASLAPTEVFGMIPVQAGALALHDAQGDHVFATYAGDTVEIEAEGGAFSVRAENADERVLLTARLPHDALVELEGPREHGVTPVALETLVAPAQLYLEKRTRLGYDTVWRSRTNLAGLEVGGKGRYARCGF